MVQSILHSFQRYDLIPCREFCLEYHLKNDVHLPRSKVIMTWAAFFY